MHQCRWKSCKHYLENIFPHPPYEIVNEYLMSPALQIRWLLTIWDPLVCLQEIEQYIVHLRVTENKFLVVEIWPFGSKIISWSSIMFCCLLSQCYEIPLKVTHSPFSDSLQSHFLLYLTLHWLHCSSASISFHSCISFLFSSSQLSALFITIKAPNEIQNSITLMDGLLHNWFIFSFSDTVVVFPEERKTRNYRALLFCIFLTYGAVHEVSFISKDCSFSGFFIFTYTQILTCQIFIKEVIRQFYL